MKVIIAGGRDFNKGNVMRSTANKYLLEEKVSEMVCGMARGADTVGRFWAEERGIPVAEFHAKWGELGRKAGPIRNEEMGRYADALVAFWDGKSRGTRHMINFMKSLGKPYMVLSYNGDLVEGEGL